MIFYIICLVLAVTGLYVSFRIYKEKHSGKPMVCPIDGPEGSCETVLTSKYSQVAGIGLEYFGMIFYGLVALGFLSLIFGIVKATVQMENFLFLIISFGLLFSIYLTVLQRFIIKNWCTYCLSSALATVAIFTVLLIKLLFF